MPNDAKLGLVLGLAVVIAIGVVYYRKDLGSAAPANSAAISADAEDESRGRYRAARGRPVNRGSANSPGDSTSGPGGDAPTIQAVPDELPPARE